MPENRNNQTNNGSCRETVCIDTYRVLDSCRDRDCFEDVRVYLTCFGQELIERTQSVRAKSAEIVSASINVDPVPFNRGFYQVNIRIYVRVTCEVCCCGTPQEIVGIAVVEKHVILFASEGNVSIFKSDPADDNYCKRPDLCSRVNTNLPIAVLETVNPILLGAKIVEPRSECCCCCSAEDVPAEVTADVGGGLVDNENGRYLVVSLGFFSVVRIERPAQYLINATEYTVPDKECVGTDEDNPCALFRTMSFPVNEFYPPSYLPNGDGHDRDPGGHCGCH